MQRRDWLKSIIGGAAAMLGLPAVAARAVMHKHSMIGEPLPGDVVFIRKAHRGSGNEITLRDVPVRDGQHDFEACKGMVIDHPIGTVMMWAGPFRKIPKGWKRFDMSKYRKAV